MSKLFEAKFTKLFKDVLEDNPDLLENISFTNPEYTQGFIDVFVNRFNIYEICTDDDEEFKELLEYNFNMNKEYFERTLDKYFQELDETLGYAYHKEYTLNKDYSSNVQIENSLSGENTTNYSSTDDATESNDTNTSLVNIELPNRPTTSEYPNFKSNTDEEKSMTRNLESSGNQSDITETTVNGNNTQTDDTNETFEEDRTGGINVIDQRERMLKYIKNIYYEFTEKFKHLFMFIYY